MSKKRKGGKGKKPKGTQLDMFGIEHDLKKARELRDEGIRRAIEGADSESPGWGEEAYRLLLQYIQLPGVEMFTSEGVRAWAHQYLEFPHDGRAWGHVIRRAAKENLIVKSGVGTSPEPKHHCSLSNIWAVVRQ